MLTLWLYSSVYIRFTWHNQQQVATVTMLSRPHRRVAVCAAAAVTAGRLITAAVVTTAKPWKSLPKVSLLVEDLDYI